MATTKKDGKNQERQWPDPRPAASRASQARSPRPAMSRASPRAVIAAYGFWQPGTTTVFYVLFADTDCATHCKVDPIKVLRSHEAKKKKKKKKEYKE